MSIKQKLASIPRKIKEIPSIIYTYMTIVKQWIVSVVLSIYNRIKNTIIYILKKIYGVIYTIVAPVGRFLKYIGVGTKKRILYIKNGSIYTAGSIKHYIVASKNYVFTKIYNSYRYTKISTRKGINLTVIKTYNTAVFVKKSIINGAIYLKNIAIYGIKSIYNAGKWAVRQLINTYKWGRQKVITIGVYIFLAVTTVYNYIVFSSIISAKISKNTLKSIKEGIDKARETDESLLTKLVEKLFNSVDKISYTLLKFALTLKGKPYNEPLFGRKETRFPTLQKWLNQANRPQTAEEYMARSVFFSFIFAIVGIFIGGLIGSFVGAELQNISLSLTYDVIPVWFQVLVKENAVPIVASIGSILISIISFVGIISISYAYAWYLANEAKRQINIHYNDAVSHMFALSQGGADIEIIIDKMAETDETTGQVAVEFRKIQDIIEYEREDITSALQIQAQRTPSDKLSSLLSDLQTVQESGTSASSILESKHNDALLEKENEAEQKETVIELLNEVVLNIGLLPIFLIILFLIQAIMGSPPWTQIYFVTYGLWAVIAIISNAGAFLIFQDESETEKTIDTNRNYAESHSQIQKIPNVIEDEVKDKTRNKTHITDARIPKILDKLYARDYRKENIIKPLINVKRRPAAILPYTLVLSVIYIGFILTSIGVPTSDMFLGSPYESYIYYIFLPLIIFAGPAIYVDGIKRKRNNKIENKLPVILDTAINSLKTGESFEESLRKTQDSTETSIIPFFNKEEGEIKKILDRSWNNLQWKHDRIYALRKMANEFEVPRMTRTMKIITDSAEFSSDLVPVLQIERKNVEKENEIKKIRASAGQMSAAIALVAVVLITGVLIVLDLYFLQTLQESAAAAGGGGGGQFGFDAEMFTTFPSLFLHTAVNVAFAFGVFAGKMAKDSFIVGLKYGILVALGVFVMYGGAGLVM